MWFIFSFLFLYKAVLGLSFGSTPHKDYFICINRTKEELLIVYKFSKITALNGAEKISGKQC